MLFCRLFNVTTCTVLSLPLRDRSQMHCIYNMYNMSALSRNALLHFVIVTMQIQPLNPPSLQRMLLQIIVLFALSVYLVAADVVARIKLI